METSENIVKIVSTQLREIVHDMNNALFVTKGFLEELSEDVKSKKYTENGFDHENFADMIDTIIRNVDKFDVNLGKLRKFAKEDIFEKSGVAKSSQE